MSQGPRGGRSCEREARAYNEGLGFFCPQGTVLENHEKSDLNQIKNHFDLQCGCDGVFLLCE